MGAPAHEDGLPEIRLTSNARGFAPLTATFLLLVAVAIWRFGLTGDNRLNVTGWCYAIGTVFFLALIGARLLRPTTLTLNAEGFILREPWVRLYGAPWRDLDSIGVVSSRYRAAGSIGFRFKPGRLPAHTWLAGLNRGLVGYDRVCPNFFGRPTSELVETMRRHCAEGSGRSPRGVGDAAT